MRRKTIGRFLLRSLLSIIAFAISIVNALQMENGNLAAFFLNLFGGIPPALGDSSMVFMLLFLNIPWILMLYLFAPLFLQDFSVQYVYVFTRVGSKGRWLWQKTARLFLQVCVSWGMVFLLCGLVGAACGFSPVGSPVLYVELFALEVLGVFTLSFAQNLLSLKLGLTQSFVLAVCVYAGALLLSAALYTQPVFSGYLMPLLPTAGQMALWHPDLAVSDALRAQFFDGAAGFFVWKSLLVEILYYAALFLGSALYFRKADLIQFIKEET